MPLEKVCGKIYIREVYKSEFGGGVCMIGFSIMMWFVSFVILMVAVALLRGNVSTMHGKVFDTTEDKVGYGKQLGKVSLFISIGLCTCGVVAFLIKSSMAIVYALVILLVVIVVQCHSVKHHFSGFLS